MHGIYNATSPAPVTNAEMMATYRRLPGAPFGLPAPRFVTYLGALAMGSDPKLAITGRRAVPRQLLDEGFVFEVTDFETGVAAALAD